MDTFHNTLFCVSITEDKNPKNSSGNTPLHFTARFGRLETVKAITKQIEDKNPKSHRFLTPLHEAANEGFPEVVKYLLTFLDETDLNVTFSTDESPLHCAARKGHLEVVQVILEHINLLDFEASVEESANLANFYGKEEVSEFIKNEIASSKNEGPKRKKLKT